MKHIKDILNKNYKEEYLLYIQNLYDEYLIKTEKRGISYGEIVYIQNLSMKELKKMEEELLQELESEEK